MNLKSLGHLWNPIELAEQTAMPVQLPAATAADGNKEVRAHINSNNSQIFQASLRTRTANIAQIKLDFNAAVGVLQKRLSDDLLSDISAAVEPTANIPAQVKFQMAWGIISLTYGPHNENDVDRITSKLKDATDADGFRALLLTHTVQQAELCSIIKRDAANNPLLDPITGLPQHYGMSDLEFRSAIMKQLKHTANRDFRSIYLSAKVDPTLSYRHIIRRCRELLTDPEEHDPKSIMVTLSSTQQTASIARPSTATNNRDLYREVEVFRAEIDNPDRSMSCRNCGRRGHRAQNCFSKTCYQCNANFGSAQERQEHGRIFHANNRNNNSQYDNNRNSTYDDRNTRSNTNYNRQSSRSRSHSQPRNDNRRSSNSHSGHGGDRSRSRDRSHSRDNNRSNNSRSSNYRPSTPRSTNNNRSRSNSRNRVSFRNNSTSQSSNTINAFIAQRSDQDLDSMEAAIVEQRRRNGVGSSNGL